MDVSVADEEVIVKEAPTDLDETLTHPGVPPSSCEVKIMRLFDVIVVAVTVAVPPESAAVPWVILLIAVPDADDPTFMPKLPTESRVVCDWAEFPDEPAFGV